MRTRPLVEVIGALLLAACATADKAVEPVWTKEPCAHCAMVLTDQRFGAQLVTSAGERFHFDDVGCMVLFASERSVPLTHAWVRDADGGVWIDARSARYRAGAASPMDFGFEAHGSGGVAWDEMRDRVLAKQAKHVDARTEP